MIKFYLDILLIIFDVFLIDSFWLVNFFFVNNLVPINESDELVDDAVHIHASYGKYKSK